MVSTSFSLLERVRGEDQAAWEQFVALYTPLLYRWAQRAGFTTQDAADVVQDIFLVLAAELRSFQYDPARGHFRGWLKTVAFNKCRERQRRRVTAPAAGGQDDPLQTLAAKDEWESLWEAEYRQQLVRKALEIMQQHFEPNTWRACWETAANGRPAAEVAQMLGITEGAVYVAKFRVLRRLRRELDGLLD
jgi:RNA polymerase sigma-70 factor (ECF subfamily)